MDTEEEILTCPYDKNHRIKCTRFKYHIVKCQEKYPNIPIYVCPYSANHRFTMYEDFKKHLLDGCSKSVPSDTYYLFWGKYIKKGNIPPILPNLRYSFSSQPSDGDEEWETESKEDDFSVTPCRVDQFEDDSDDHLSDNEESSSSRSKSTDMRESSSTSPTFSFKSSPRKPNGLIRATLKKQSFSNELEISECDDEEYEPAFSFGKGSGSFGNNGYWNRNSLTFGFKKPPSEYQVFEDDGEKYEGFSFGRGAPRFRTNGFRNSNGLTYKIGKKLSAPEDRFNAMRIPEDTGSECEVDGDKFESNGDISEVNGGEPQVTYSFGRGSRSFGITESRNPRGLRSKTKKKLTAPEDQFNAIKIPDDTGSECEVDGDKFESNGDISEVNESEPQVTYSFGRGSRSFGITESRNPRGLRSKTKKKEMAPRDTLNALKIPEDSGSDSELVGDSKGDISKVNGDVSKVNGDISKVNGDIAKVNGRKPEATYSFGRGIGRGFRSCETSESWNSCGLRCNAKKKEITPGDALNIVRIPEDSGRESELDEDKFEGNGDISKVSGGKCQVTYSVGRGIGRGLRSYETTEPWNPCGLRSNAKKKEMAPGDSLNALKIPEDSGSDSELVGDSKGDISKVNGDVSKVNGDISKVNGDIAKVNGRNPEVTYSFGRGIGRGFRSCETTESWNPCGSRSNTKKMLSGADAFLAAITKCQLTEDLNDNESEPEVGFKFGRGKMEKIEHSGPNRLKYSSEMLKNIRDKADIFSEPSCSVCSTLASTNKDIWDHITVSQPSFSAVKCARVPYKIIPG